jgi:hypothetical protein
LMSGPPAGRIEIFKAVTPSRKGVDPMGLSSGYDIRRR